jgi:hypothetical protein
VRDDPVGEGGLEPPRPYGHRHLKPARLPIPPLARGVAAYQWHPHDLPGDARPHPVDQVSLDSFPIEQVSLGRRSDARSTLARRFVGGRDRGPCGSARGGERGSEYNPAVGLQGFERRLERLVEGTFNKAFRSGLQPVEIGHRMTRVLDAGRTLGVSGRQVAPNNIGVYLAPADYETFQSFAEALARELAEMARAHAREEDYQFVGPVTVSLVSDTSLKTGEVDVVAEIAEGAGGQVGSLVLPDGRRVRLGEDPATLGRNADCTVTLADPRASREHAEIRATADGFLVTDLGSMNGTLVNGVRVKEHVLHDGDEVAVGSTVMRFEAS